jgi:hypothetical protein
MIVTARLLGRERVPDRRLELADSQTIHERRLLE